MSTIVEFRAVSFSYPAVPRRTGFRMRQLSFAIERGEVLGVIGPNASGKTTLIRLLSRVLTPDQGDIVLDGRSLAACSRAEAARRIGVVPQDAPRGFPYTVEELVLMGRFPHAPGRYFETGEDLRAARRAMEATGIDHLAGAALDRLSGGERQRAMLARALAQQPALLALDEPMAHLDLRHQTETVRLLHQLNAKDGLTVLLVSHDLNLAAEISDRLLLLDGGGVARFGPPESVLEERLLESVYGCPLVRDKHPLSGRPTVQPVWPGSERR
jgi:iron complex transport system ATP-binding protein